ncbi:MAG: low-specificity L-threonine aldolase [Burkholderiaceae bacterium]
MTMPATIVDLRSDTVTRPTAAMRAAMAAAEVGDDVYADDPTVNRLQAVLAARLGKEAALFMPSGTQSNLCALMVHCTRGDEYLVGQGAHCYRYEGGGGAVLGSIQPQPLVQDEHGAIALADITAAIKPDDTHFARTRLLALENTFGGQVLPWAFQVEATSLARHRGLATHLDGARLFNAAVAMAGPGGDPWVEARRLAGLYDTVSVCFSKGLGAPVGSALVGSADHIDAARRWRKMLGGGLRQAGVLAAAALHALDHHVARLADDHALASALADGLSGQAGVQVRRPETNIVFVTLDGLPVTEALARLRAAGIWAGGSGDRLRLVTHLDVDADGIDRAVRAFRALSGGA